MISRRWIFGIFSFCALLQPTMVRAKIKAPPQFEALQRDGWLAVAVTERKGAIEYQKVMVFSPGPAPQDPMLLAKIPAAARVMGNHKLEWEFIPPLPQQRGAIDPQMERDVQLQRVFFSCFTWTGTNIAVCVGAIRYVLDFNTGVPLP